MSSLKNKISSGVVYTAISKYSSVLISLIVSSVLARLLSPEEFGVVALVLVFVTFFNLLSDFGIGPAIIQNKELNDGDIKSIFSFSALVGVLLATIFFFASHFISYFYENKALINVTRFLSLAILFFSLTVVPKSLLLKQLKFKQVGLVTTGIQLFTGALSIALAVKNFSYYSLVIRSICEGALLFFAYYCLSPISFTFRINVRSIKKIAKFSLYQFMFNFVNYFSRNADSLLIGKFFGQSALGFYDRAYRLMTLPVQNLTHVVTPVLLPVFSDYQHNKEKIFFQYLRMIDILALVGFPLSVLLYFTSAEIIEIMYGSAWFKSIAIFKLLAITIGIQIVLSSSGAIFQAVNRTDLLFTSGLISSLFMVTGICYGLFFCKNLEGVAYGLIAAFILSFFQSFYFLIHVALQASFVCFLKVFSFPIFISFVLIITLSLISTFLSVNLYYALFIKAAVTALVYFVLILCSDKYRSLFLRTIWKN